LFLLGPTGAQSAKIVTEVDETVLGNVYVQVVFEYAGAVEEYPVEFTANDPD
jgi:hypothetical protein